MKFTSFGIGACAFALTFVALGDSTETLRNWPQWRGPLGTGVAPDADPPLTWNETKNVKWKVTIPGAGSSTPVVWGDRVFVLTALPVPRSPEGKGDLAAEKPSPQDAPVPETRPPGRGGGG